MTKPELVQQLHQHHSDFIQLIEPMDEAEFIFKPSPLKWSAGEQLEHLVLSVSPFRKVLILPKILLAMLFGKANRPSKSYIELVAKYHSKLQSGGAASSRFIPARVAFAMKSTLIKQLEIELNKLCALIDKCKEGDLDSYILPHPLLGKLTLREMIYFTVYHVQHHQQTVRTYLLEKK